MVPESSTPTTAPLGRPKRATASKAEHLFRSLVNTGGAAQSSSYESDPRRSIKAAGEEAGGEVDDPDRAGSESGGSDSSAGGGESGGEGSGGGGITQPLLQTKRKCATSSASGRAKKRGKLKQQITGDRPLKSETRGSGNGRGQPNIKPRPAANEASLAKLLERLNGWNTKVRVPAHPTLEDVWKAVDAVLRNLPPTYDLTVDALLGCAPRLRRYSREKTPLAMAEGGSSSSSTTATTSGGSRHMAGSGGSFCNDGEHDQAVPPIPSKQKHDPVLQTEGGFGGGGVGEEDVCEDGLEDESAAAAAAECARGRLLPHAKSVDDDVQERDAALQKLELKITACLQRVATKVEELRYDENSPEESRWREFSEKTLRAYKPLEERDERDRAEAKAKQSKQLRLEQKRKKEEDIAVCYVCNSGDHIEDNEEHSIVFCDRCCVAVHTSCYGASEIHKTEKWYCDFCSYVVSKAQRHLEAVIAAAESASTTYSDAHAPTYSDSHAAAGAGAGAGVDMKTVAKKRKLSNSFLETAPTPAPAPPARSRGESELGVPASAMAHLANGGSGTSISNGSSLATHRSEHQMNIVGAGENGDAIGGGEERSPAAAAVIGEGPPRVGTGSDKDKRKPPVAAIGWEASVTGSAAGTTAASPPPDGIVAAAEAWCGVESSRLKRDAQKAKKRSWDDFENEGSCGSAEASALKGEGEGVDTSAAFSFGSDRCSSSSGPKTPPPRPRPPPIAGDGWLCQDKPPTTTAGSFSTSDPGFPGASTAAAAAGGVSRPPGGGRRTPALTSDGKPAAMTKPASTHKLASRVGDTPEVAAARAALEEVEAVVGVDLPSLDKGPPDAEADCLLCHVPRGAFLRAERGTGAKGLGWCHTLCAFSKGLLIEDRVVKTRGHIKGDGTVCGFCKKSGGGIIKCSEKDCDATFHPLCGIPWGGSAVRGPHLHPERWLAWCPKHAAAAKGAGVGGGVAATMPLSGRMPVKDMYKTSKASLQKAFLQKAGVVASKSSPPSAAAAAAAAVATPRTGPSSPMAPGPRPRWVSTIEGDPVVKALRREVRTAMAQRHQGPCGAGFCHQCRRRNKWTAPCSMCPNLICGYCVSLHKESPMAVWKEATTRDEALRNGRPPPKKSFKCYQCRGVCFCKDCKGPGVRAKNFQLGSGLLEAGTTAAAAATAVAPVAAADASPAVRAKPMTLAPSRATRVPLAPKLIEEDGRPTPPQKRLASAMTGAAMASGSDKRARTNPPSCSSGDGNSQQQPHQLQQLLQQHRQQQQKQQQQQQPQRWQQLQHHLSHHHHPQQQLSSLSSYGTPVSSSGALHGTPTFVPVGMSSLASVLLAEEDVVGPWGASPAAPALATRDMPSSSNASHMPSGNNVNPLGSWSSQVSLPSGRGGPAGTGFETQLNGGGKEGGGSQANGGSYPNGYVSGLAASHPHHGLAAAAAAAAATNAASASGAWRCLSKVPLSLPVRSISVGMPAINVSVSPMSLSNTSSSSNPAAINGAPPAAAAAAAAAEMAASGGVRTAADAARIAELYRQRAITERQTAQKLTEDVLDAKAFSDRNNKAAMWRVEAATKLKDKLIMANELISGYCEMRRIALEEVRNALEAETRAVAQFRKAEAHAALLLEAAEATRATPATGSPSWNDNSSSSSTTSNTSSSGGATTSSASSGSIHDSALIKRTESPASALTAAMASHGTSNGGVRDPMSMSATPTSSGHEPTSSQGMQQNFLWANRARLGWSSNAQQQARLPASPANSASSATAGDSASGQQHNGDCGGANNRPSSSPFDPRSSPRAGAQSPAGVLSAVVDSGGGGTLSSSSSPSGCCADDAFAAAARAKAAADKLFKAAQVATATYRVKERNVIDIATRQSRAEAGRAELVRETQYASDSASKASQAAMHYEQVARLKRGEEQAALERLSHAEWDAKNASEQARRLAEAERRQNAFPGAVMAAVAASNGNGNGGGAIGVGGSANVDSFNWNGGGQHGASNSHITRPHERRC